MIPNTSRALSI